MSGYPKQKDNISKNSNPQFNREAIAPYNFVELPDRVVRAEEVSDHDRVTLVEDGKEHPFLVRQDRYIDERHTGYMTCTLVADSPIYVRTGLSPEEFAAIAGKGFDELKEDQKQRYAQFFALQQAPAIPGSSLRGVLRALVEIAGHGKVMRVTNRQQVYRAVGDTTSLGDKYRSRLMEEDEDEEFYFTPLMQAGYMEQNGDQWFIRPAQNIGGVTFCRIEIDRIPQGLSRWKNTRNAYEIWIEPGPFDYQPIRGGFIHIRFSPVLHAGPAKKPGLQLAVLNRSGRMNKKRHEMVVFAADRAAPLIPVDYELIQAYKEQISKEQQALLGNSGVLVPDQPVFYLVEKDRLIFFGHTFLFRIPYHDSPRDFVPAALRDPSDTDLAEALFGYVPDGDNDTRQPYAGRVFVEDAQLILAEQQRVDDLLLRDGQKPYVTPRILGSPKPTTFQHYLVQKNDARNQLTHYASPPETETVIRGHKLYWHQEQARQQSSQDWLGRVSEQDDEKIRRAPKQYTGIQPLAPNARFKVCIRFENLSDVELGALLWLMRLAGEESYRLKLGMGKPLGMGSVHLEDLQVVCSNRQQRYASLFDQQGSEKWATGENNLASKEQNDCVTAFQQHVLQHSGLQAPSFDELPRIKMLLALLSWPGPQHDSSYRPAQDRTRSMEIERPENKGYVSGRPNNRGNVNEYANRPVLPGPWQVLEQTAPTRYPLTEPPAPISPQTDTPRQLISALPKQLGIIEQIATAEQPGRLQDKEGKSYPYLLTDVIADASLSQHQRVLFRVEKRKISEGKGKKGQEKKWRFCAVEVELMRE